MVSRERKQAVVSGDAPVEAPDSVLKTGAQTSEEAVHGRREPIAGGGRMVNLIKSQTSPLLGGCARWKTAGKSSETVEAV